MFDILIVDDDDNVLKSLARLFRSNAYRIVCLHDPQEALLQCGLQNFDLIISDQRMPEMEGTEFFAHIAQSFPAIRRILVSGYSDFASVTEAFNEGIIHKFVIKPWDNDALKALVAAQLKEKQKRSSDSAVEESPDINDATVPAALSSNDTENFHGIVTSDPALLQQLRIIRQSANSDAPFFIHGETGTGKELIARAIHLESRRSKEAFVALNCANLTENLLESQLFGHVKGAFTGADKDQKGLLSAAEKGTLFLDEVTEIPLSLQAKLLRVLQEREYSPVGQTKTIPFDVQLISASSTSLEDAVANGKFREDLRYRLEIIPLSLPPLRERHADISQLFIYFLHAQFARQKRVFREIDGEVLDCILKYPWPGNVRELVNVCTYVAALFSNERSRITLDQLPPAIRSSATLVPARKLATPQPRQSIGDLLGNTPVTRENLIEAIAKYAGNRNVIAQSFGISRMTLWRKMKQFEIE